MRREFLEEAAFLLVFCGGCDNSTVTHMAGIIYCTTYTNLSFFVAYRSDNESSRDRAITAWLKIGQTATSGNVPIFVCPTPILGAS